MSENLILGIITAVTSVVTSMSLVNWRLKSLEAKVDSHNGYAKMFYEHSTDIKLLQTDVEYIKRAIDRVEDRLGE